MPSARLICMGASDVAKIALGDRLQFTASPYLGRKTGKIWSSDHALSIDTAMHFSHKNPVI